MVFEKNISFELACQVRPVKAFHPESLLENDMDNFRRFLSNDTKLLWFHQFCAENGIPGRIDTEFSSAETLKDIPHPDIPGGLASPIKEYWTATVYMGDTVVSRATVSGTFLVNDQAERDNASNQLRKSAIGSALSQAGFGIISGFYMTANDIAQLTAEMAQMGSTTPPAQTQPAPNPVSAPSNTIPGNMMQNSLYGNTAPNPFGNAPVRNSAPIAPSYTSPASTVTQGPVSEDPVVAAKRGVWPGGGRFKGKTLGEILSEPGGAKNITWIANEYTARTEEGHKIQEAAKLILSVLETGN